MSVNVSLVVSCGFTGCPWSMQIDPSAGADTMTVHQAYLDHLDDHELGDDIEPECETTDRFIDAVHAQWAAHDAEVARALAEDGIPGAPRLRGTPAEARAAGRIIGGFYNEQLYPPPKPEDQVPAGTILCSDPACVMGRWKHSHPEGWPEHPSYKGGLYAGDTPEQIAAEQARIDRFMAGGNDA